MIKGKRFTPTKAKASLAAVVAVAAIASTTLFGATAADAATATPQPVIIVHTHFSKLTLGFVTTPTLPAAEGVVTTKFDYSIDGGSVQTAEIAADGTVITLPSGLKVAGKQSVTARTSYYSSSKVVVKISFAKHTDKHVVKFWVVGRDKVTGKVTIYTDHPSFNKHKE